MSGPAVRVSLISVVALLLFPVMASAEYGLNFQKPASEIAHDVYNLHMLIMLDLRRHRRRGVRRDVLVDR
ncbi:MAG: hypothetical protein MZV65_20495 [Chromatiales bacterium]|nr:hypothetical protein [Chromatiales bacterium]